MSTTSADKLLDLRLTLVSNGYRPLPLEGKRPMVKGWTTGEIDEARIRKLHEERPYDTNTGIRCDGLVVPDIDVRDATVGRAIFKAMERHFGKSVMLRMGRSPKVASVYRMAGADIKKRATPKYILNGEDAQVEILNGSGCQFVAYGVHPDTGTDYRWAGATPEAVPLANLPAVTADLIALFQAECSAIIEAAGGVLKAGGISDGGGERAAINSQIWGREAAVIEVLLGRLDLRTVLEDNDYEAADNERERYSCPGASKTSKPALRILVGDRDGVERACSDHATDQLNRHAPHGFGGALNAIEVIAVLKHGGDLQKAIVALCEEHSIERGDFGALDPLPVTAEAKRRWAPIHADDLESLPDLEYLVDGILPATGLAAVYGPPKSGKSFATLSFAACIAGGLDWFSHVVKAGAVVYIAGEGYGGAKQRLRAARQVYGMPQGSPLHFIPRAVPLGDPAEMRRFINDIKASICEPIRLVVIDTLARCMPGLDENSTKDMSSAIAQCDKLREAFDCLVLLVHHSGKETSKGMRGSSSLLGAVDANIKVSRVKSATADAVCIAVENQKDGEEAAPIMFDMATIVVGEDQYGRDITSKALVLRQAPMPAGQESKAGPKVKPWAVEWHNALLDAVNRIGATQVSVDDWIAAAETRGIANPSRNAMRMAKSHLRKVEWIEAEGDAVWSLVENDSDLAPLV